VGPTRSSGKDRYSDINAFEHHLHRSKTRIVKVFLHVSKEEQKNRFLSRLEVPAKNWKFSVADLAERQHWDEYQGAYEEALSATSTRGRRGTWCRPDHKYALRALVAHHRRRDRSDGPEVPEVAETVRRRSLRPRLNCSPNREMIRAGRFRDKTL